jgi:hypothetical protein
MADQSPQVFVTNVGVFTNALMPLFKAPSGYGGVTIIGWQVMMYTAGTAQLYLVDGGAAGTTTTGGTLGTSGGTAHTAKTPIAGTVATSPYLAEGSYLTLKENNVGSTVTITQVAVTYRFGK